MSTSKEKRRAGRRSKLTPERAERLIAYIRAGNFINTACELVGIDPSTFHRWMQRGESGESRYREFCEQVREAQAYAEARALMHITQAFSESWQAAAWYLERTRPHKFGRTAQITHEPSDALERLIDAMMQAASRDIIPDSTDPTSDEQPNV